MAQNFDPRQLLRVFCRTVFAAAIVSAYRSERLMVFRTKVGASIAESYADVVSLGMSQIFLLVLRARAGFMADDGPRRSRSDLEFEESGVRACGKGDRSFDIRDHLPSPRSERSRSGDRVRDTDGAECDVVRSISFVSRSRRPGSVCVVGKPRRRRRKEHRDLSVAAIFPGRDDGVDFVLAEFFR